MYSGEYSGYYAPRGNPNPDILVTTLCVVTPAPTLCVESATGRGASKNTCPCSTWAPEKRRTRRTFGELLMSKKRLLLIESGRFIGGVIRSLFSQDLFSVIETAPANSRELLLSLKKHRPEVIVLDDTVQVDYLPDLLRYMQNSDGIQVVIVNAESNQVEVYQKQQIALNHTADFFAIL
jgi:hypothetical protein